MSAIASVAPRPTTPGVGQTDRMDHTDATPRRPSTQPPARANRAGEARRQRVLEVAVEHFTRLGYRGASLAAIAREAGITDAGLLHHFGTKAELFRAVVSWREVPFVEAFTRRPASLDELFTRLAEAERESLEHPGLVRFQATLAGEMSLAGHPFHDEYVAKQRDALHRLAELVDAFDGELAAGVRPLDVARELIALHHGLRSEWLIMPEGIDLGGAFAAALGRLRRAIAG